MIKSLLSTNTDDFLKLTTIYDEYNIQRGQNISINF